MDNEAEIAVKRLKKVFDKLSLSLETDFDTMGMSGLSVLLGALDRTLSLIDRLLPLTDECDKAKQD